MSPNAAPATQSEQVVCGQVVCGEVVCEQVVCGQVVCEQVVCGQVVCGQVVGGGGRRRRRAGGGNAEPKTRTPHKDVGKTIGYWLVVWNMNFMTFHRLGIIIPTDFHIFQRG